MSCGERRARLLTLESTSHNNTTTVENGDAARRWLVTVSRVVWDHIVEPAIVSPSHNRGVPLTRPQCHWLMGLADALFPLVPRACRLLTGGGGGCCVTVSLFDDEDYGMPNTSRYFGLVCAGAAGSKRCIEWIVKNKSTRNNKKECIAVLRGLCLGGHLDMAKELVEGGDTPWCGCELLRWPAGDRDVIDDLREIRYSGTVSCSLLYDACKGGNLEVVRWVMSSFRDVGTAAWEFPMPFRAAVRWGRLDVVKWLNSSTGSVPACLEMLRYNADDCSLANFVASQSLEVVKFCTELFCGYEPNENRDEILEKFIEYCPIGCDVDEGCQWIKDKFSLTKEHCPSLSLISSFKNAKGFKWLINTFSLKPIQEELRCACTDIADQELTEWLITNFSDSVGPVETDTLISACGNKKDSVSVLQVLISNLRTPLKEEEMTQCLVASLSRSNTSIAEWLEKKFHVMNHVNSVPRLTDETFTKVCSSPNGSGIGGIQWFISNCAVTNISERTVIDAIRFFSTEKKILPMLLLLKTFEVSIVSDNDKANMVHTIVSRGNLPQAKQIVSRVSFSSENVAQGLSQGGRKSGKVVKWFIQQFHLNESQVKRNDNRLLFKLIDGNKTSCAEWLIRKFHVTLPEIGAMTDMHGIDASVSLVCTWKMLLRVFPEMTLSFAKRYLWEYATAFHLHLKASRKMLGLTDADLVAEDDFSYLWTNAWIP